MDFLQRGFGGKITLKVICDKSVALNDCSIFENNSFLDWLMRRDQIDMWFELVLIKRSKYFLIGFAIILSRFKHVTNISSKPILHLELEEKISPVSKKSLISLMVESA